MIFNDLLYLIYYPFSMKPSGEMHKEALINTAGQDPFSSQLGQGNLKS